MTRPASVSSELLLRLVVPGSVSLDRKSTR
ncbi:MAG: hypothetical protein JWL64_2294, partial [Frankiales bacterium]|nr:hypothetical protein [Frankiales bacterium]